MCLFFVWSIGVGKAAAEDEDSMDGLETAETENIVETGVKA